MPIRLILLLLVLAGVVPALRAEDNMAANEMATAAACKAFAEAEEIYHRTDYTGNGCLKYCQALHGAREFPTEAVAPELPKDFKLTEEDREKIGKLIKTLKDDDFATREKAFNDLKAFGPKAKEQCEAAAKSDTDAEVVSRCKKLVAIAQGNSGTSVLKKLSEPKAKIDLTHGLFSNKIGSEPGDLSLIDKTFADAECPQGCDPKSIAPKNGYLFRVLTQQGASATGGKRNYIVAGNMTLGYALLAFPKDYGTTGKDCFIINGNGTIFQRDLGTKEKTEEFAKDCIEFDPTVDWVPTQ